MHARRAQGKASASARPNREAPGARRETGPGRPRASCRLEGTSTCSACAHLACRLSPSCVLQEARQRQWARRDRWETEWASGHARRGRDAARSTHTRNSIRAEAVEELGPRPRQRHGGQRRGASDGSRVSGWERRGRGCRQQDGDAGVRRGFGTKVTSLLWGRCSL